MKIRVIKLRETLSLLGPVVPRKPSLPILSSVLVKEGQVTATDLETAVSIGMPEAEEPMLLPYHQVMELLKHVPGDEVLTAGAEKNKLTLSWSGGKAAFLTKSPESYPPPREVKPKAEHSVEGDDLVSALVSASGYSATETSRPVLTGVFLTLGETVEVAASDGFRMACQQVSGVGFQVEGVKHAVIPSRTVRILGELWERSPKAAPVGDSLIRVLVSKRKLELAIGEQTVRASFGEVTVVARLIQGTPPDYKALIPETPAHSIRVFAPDMQHALRRVRNVAQEGSGIVRLEWADGSLKVSSQSMDAGEVEATIPVEVLSGGPGRVAVNASYLLNYFKEKQGMVTIGTAGAGPVILRDNTPLLVLVMPMAVKWDSAGEAKPAQVTPPANPTAPPTAQPVPQPDTTVAAEKPEDKQEPAQAPKGGGSGAERAKKEAKQSSVKRAYKGKPETKGHKRT